MREILLTQGFVAIVDDEDYTELAKYRWQAARRKTAVYAQRTSVSDGKTTTVIMHRAILGAPKGQGIDHQDGDGLNNQRANLRFATDSQNSANKPLPATNTSGRRGVHWHRRGACWRAGIKKDGKLTHLGLFKDLDDAARAYDAAARKLHGEFARPNFPGDANLSPALSGWTHLPGQCCYADFEVTS